MTMTIEQHDGAVREFDSQAVKAIENTWNGMDKEQLLSTIFCTLADVKDEKKEYVYPPYIPAGKITVFPGDPGCGKSKFVFGIVALITRGLPLLGIPCGKPGHVLVFSTEDDSFDVKKTVAACGGDVDKVTVLSEKDEALKILAKEQITFKSPIVEWAIEKYQPSLVVFDPFQRYAGKGDTNKATDTNAAMKPLTILGKKYGCAFLIIVHNAKGNAGNLLYKSSGSQDIVGNARSVLSVVRDPEKPDQCLAIHTKSNNKRGKTIRYAIRSIEGDEDFATVDLLGLEDYTERDYWKALRHQGEQELAAQITDDDPIVQTMLSIIIENPHGVRVRKDDFWTAAEKITGAVVSDSIGRILAKYRGYMWDNHGIGIKSRPSQTLQAFKVNGETFNPSKSPDRCMEIYKGRIDNIHVLS